MKPAQKKASQLAAELRPFVQKQRNTCFSEIEQLLHEILEYLEGPPANSFVDPTIRNQLELPLEIPKPGDIRYQQVAITALT